MCREAAVPELAARKPGIVPVQMWVCDLVMSRKTYMNAKCEIQILYWLRLLKATDYLSQREFLSIYTDCVELEKILVSIINSANG